MLLNSSYRQTRKNGNYEHTIEGIKVFRSQLDNYKELKCYNDFKSFFSKDINDFLNSLHLEAVNCLLKDFYFNYLSKMTSEFENKIRSLETYSKYQRKLKYKKRPIVQFT